MEQTRLFFEILAWGAIFVIGLIWIVLWFCAWLLSKL